MKTKVELQNYITSYQKALTSLTQSVETYQGAMKDQDSVIQRFEYVIEMSRKLAKYYMEYMGVIDLQYPRQVIKEMYYHKLINDLELWDRMIDMRNTLSHNYDEDFASDSADFIRHHTLSLFQGFIACLEQQLLANNKL